MSRKNSKVRREYLESKLKKYKHNKPKSKKEYLEKAKDDKINFNLTRFSYPKRNEIYLIDLSKYKDIDYNQDIRPCVIISSNINNEHSKYIQVVAMSSVKNKVHIPTHVTVKKNPINNLSKDSQVICEQIFTVSKDDFIKFQGKVCKDNQLRINKAIMLNLALN